jgi:hypothetical protein
MVCCWQKNEQQESGAEDNRQFCMKIGKSASETLALLTLAYGEYTLKKLSVFEWHRQFKEGQDDMFAVQDHDCVFHQSQGDSPL